MANVKNTVEDLQNHIDDLIDERFELTERLRTDNAINSHNTVIDLKNKIDVIDNSITQIINIINEKEK